MRAPPGWLALSLHAPTGLPNSPCPLVRQDLHRLRLPALDDLLRLDDPFPGRFRIRRDVEHRDRYSFPLLLVIHVEKPIAQADVTPHQPLARLLRPAADHGRDAVADTHD